MSSESEVPGLIPDSDNLVSSNSDIKFYLKAYIAVCFQGKIAHPRLHHKTWCNLYYREYSLNFEGLTDNDSIFFLVYYYISLRKQFLKNQKKVNIIFTTKNIAPALRVETYNHSYHNFFLVYYYIRPNREYK